MLESVKSLLKIGPGPSSSHTIGPFKAASHFKSLLENKDVSYIKVILYGSLALTGKGHLTDKIIIDTLKEYKVQVIFDVATEVSHPNTVTFLAYDNMNEEILSQTYISVGGGKIIKKGEKEDAEKTIYPFDTFKDLKDYLESNKMGVRDLVIKYEGEEIISYFEEVYDTMVKTIKKGLVTEGEVAPKLHVKRVAKEIFEKAQKVKDPSEKQILTLSSYAYATAECNAAGELVVTSPTCGSAGVLPSCLYYFEHDLHYAHDKVIDGLILASLVGLIIRKNATISGAVGGCQAEIGSACSMAAASMCYIDGLNLHQCSYAAEIGMEHNLGLTCDPVMGYVAIPCIERNSIAALKAYDAFIFARNIAPIRSNYISFDEVIKVMYETGLSLNKDYKETSKGGLAKLNKGEC